MQEKNECWEIHILRPPGLVFEIMIPFTVLEWFVTAKDPAGGNEIWNDWMDYYPLNNESKDTLQSQMEEDIQIFVEHLFTCELRVIESKGFFARRHRIEWKSKAGWEKISLYTSIH